MFKPNDAPIETIRALYRLDSRGNLTDHSGNLIHPRRRGVQASVPVGDEWIAYRRAVWACAHDSMPKVVYRIDKQGGEALGNLSDTPVKFRTFVATAKVGNRQVSLGSYPTKEEARAVVEAYKEHGAFYDIDRHRGAWRIYRRVADKVRTIGLYPTQEMAQTVIRGFERYGQRVPGYAVSSITGLRHLVGVYRDAYVADVAVHKWIAEQGYILGFDRIDKI
jgi:hypothetical protein